MCCDELQKNALLMCCNKGRFSLCSNNDLFSINRARKYCHWRLFSAQGNCIQFHTLPFHLPQPLWGFVNKVPFVSEYPLSPSAGNQWNRSIFLSLIIPFVPHLAIFFKFQVICGSFMLPPCFICTKIRLQLCYHWEDSHTKEKLTTLFFFSQRVRLYIVFCTAVHSMAHFSKCTCKLQLHIRRLL